MPIPVETPSGVPDRTVLAYERLAREYDSRAHATTRSLEEASSRALRSALDAIEVDEIDRVVELGCGTGATTRELLALLPSARLISSDPSAEMLDIARRRFGSRATVEWRQSTAAEMLAWDRIGPRDLLVGGLSDPFLTPRLVQQLGEVVVPGGRSLWTLPSATWALRERQERLRLPLASTRFVLSDGKVVVADSFAYDPPELRHLFGGVGMTVRVGVKPGPPPATSRLPTEVAWALVERPASVSGGIS